VVVVGLVVLEEGLVVGLVVDVAEAEEEEEAEDAPLPEDDNLCFSDFS